MDQCPFCGMPASREARFCKDCGRQIAMQRVSSQKAVLPEDFDVSAVVRLREERGQLSRDLNAMLDIASERDLTPEEERQWEALRDEFRKVSDELTARLDYLSARQDRDRRDRDRRGSDRRLERAAIDFDERRSGIDRRIGDRRSGRDRRDPFGDTEP